MKKIAYLLDSTLTVSKEETEATKDFFFIPLYAIIEGELYKDMIDIQAEEFYEAVRAGKDVSTTQASAGELLEKYEEIRDAGYTDVFVFMISSTLSGATQTAIAMAEEVEGINVHVVDSKTVTGVGTFLIHDIVKYIEANPQITPEEVIEYAKEVGGRLEFYLSINTLESLRKGGRLSNTAAIIGNLLNIKPIVTIKHGVIEAAGQERTVKKGMKRIVEMAGKRKFSEAYLLHSSNQEIIDMLEKDFVAKFPDIPYTIMPISPVIGVHTGPEVGAVAFVYEKE